MKFKGKFKELKSKGYTFQKLFARNYKCYHKDTDEGFTIWIWVHHGGYIELNDFYSHTEALINKMKTINWADVKLKKSFFGKDYKNQFIRFNHSKPENGYEIFSESLDLAESRYERENNVDFETAFDKVRELHDREFRVSEIDCADLLKELDLLTK